VPDLAGDELPSDVYRLVFHPRSPFFRRIEVEVEIGEGHHHVPLLLAPYSCAIYRGS
jgi:5-hydroxyisourate hydrolase-like protein (transthyretin family)